VPDAVVRDARVDVVRQALLSVPHQVTDATVATVSVTIVVSVESHVIASEMAVAAHRVCAAAVHRVPGCHSVCRVDRPGVLAAVRTPLPRAALAVADLRGLHDRWRFRLAGVADG